jgi:subtilisin-like proprotein convertase family protein
MDADWVGNGLHAVKHLFVMAKPPIPYRLVLAALFAGWLAITCLGVIASEDGREIVLQSANGQIHHWEIALDELAGSAAKSRIICIPPQPTRSALRQRALEFLQTQATEPAFVLYPAGQQHNEQNRHILSSAVAVRLANNVSPEALGKYSGAVSFKPTRSLRNWFIFKATTPNDSLTLADRLKSTPGVLFAEPQLARLRQGKHLPDDEFIHNQWHLQNSGQTGGPPGIDINIANVWNQWRGADCVIGIVDTGFETNHPDLAINHRSDLSANLDGNPFDPETSWHGTLVAGIAAARGDNSIGVVGVAYESGLADLRISEMSNDPQEAEAMALFNEAIQVKNNSWGAPDATIYDPPRLDGPGYFTVAALADGTTSGRNGLGQVYVFPAGNGRAFGDNANYDGYANSPYVICVGAVNDMGEQSSYSESGACLALCAPSGSGPSTCDGGRTRLATTDLTGDFGVNTNGIICDLTDRCYTTNFSGTSASVPVVSGVSALMLQSRPQLNWRDVKEILMRTATKTIPNDPDWATNSSGLATNPKCGAGLVNAHEALHLAKTWLPAKPMTKIAMLETNLNLEIPDNYPIGTNCSFLITNSGFRVETVALTTTITHDRWGDLEIKLISPNGIVSPLAEPHTSSGNSGIPGWTFTSVRNWGDDAQGVWTVQVADLVEDFTGAIVELQLEFYGSQPATLSLLKTNVDSVITLSVSPANWQYRRYTVEASSDLFTWTYLTTLEVDQTGGACCVDANSNNLTSFYRVIPVKAPTSSAKCP